jgi:hypothetical protein
MKSFKQFREEAEMDYNGVELLLKGMGYTNLKKVSGSKIAVLTNDNRIKTLEKIQANIKGAKYDTTPGSDSSAGRVKIGAISVLAKPASKQGKASAGVENEHMVVDFINTATASGPVNVIFDAENGVTFEVFGCTGAKAVGGDTAGRKKADIVLTDYKGNEYPISIKKDDAETWESADSYFGAMAEKIIDKAVAAGITTVVKHTGYVTIEPNIAVAATTKEKRDVVFGSDLEGKGCVVTKTFNSRSFEQQDDMIVIDCKHIITSMAHVKGDKDVYFLIRNDKTRKSIKKYPGIRVLAAYAKRINKNVKIVKR